jgi:WD40 repeat protein
MGRNLPRTLETSIPAFIWAGLVYANTGMAGALPVIPDYELLRPIGRGAYGEVWLARSITGIYRAAKIVYRATFEEARPFDREFAGIQRFEPVSRAQENQITILHVGRNETEGYFYYVMELADDATTDGPTVDSPTLFNAASYRPKTLKEVLSRQGRLPVRECLPVAIGLCNALEHLHSHGLIHRDVKPSNIIFVNGQPKLADIGLVSSVDATRSFVGTEGYVPREGPGSPTADLYGLGKVLYEITSGRPRQDFPLLPENLELLDDRTALLELNEVVVKACAENAADRYPCAADMRAELLLLQAGRSVRRLHAAERRDARLIPVVVGVCLIAGIALFVQHLQTRSARERARVAQEFRERAEGQELRTRQLLYAADMNLVHQAYAAGDLGLAQSLLSGHLPAPGQTDLRGFEWYYFQTRCEGEQRHTFTGFSNAVKAVAISADGAKLAGGSYDHEVRVWSLTTRTLEVSFDGGGMIEDVGFSPDGKYLAYCGGAGRLTFQELDAGRMFSVAENGVVRMAMSPKGRLVAFARGEVRASGLVVAGTNGPAVEVWDYGVHQRILTLPEPSDYLRFSSDGRMLAAVGLDGNVRVWNIDLNVPAGTFGPVSVRSPVSFSPDGGRIAAGDDAGIVRIWDLGDGRLLRQAHAHAGTIWDIAYSPKADVLVTAGTDQTVRVYDAESLAELNVLRGHAGEVWRVAFSPDGGTLSTGSKDGTVRIWSVDGMQSSDVFTRRVEFWNWPVFCKDGELLAVGERSLVTVRGVNDGRALAVLANARRPLGFLDGNRELMALGMEGEIQFWNWRAETNRPSRSIAANLTNVRAHAFFASSNLLAVGDRDGSIRLWDLERKTQLASWKAHSSGIICLAISPDGLVLASSSAEDEDSVKLWSIPDGKLKATPSGHKLGVFGVAFSPDGRLLASASVDDTCRLWETATGNQIIALAGHKGGAFHAAFSPDGRTLVVGTGDKKVKLWNVATFRDMGTIEVEPVSVFHVGFVPGQAALATVSFDFARTNCSLRLLRALPARSAPIHAASLHN